MNKYIAPAILTTSLFMAPESAAEVPIASPVIYEPAHKEVHTNPGDSNTPDIYVEWDGTVLEALPDPTRNGYIKLHQISNISAQALRGFTDWEKGFYQDETLEGGAITFKNGNIEDCGAVVYREGGGWSYPAVHGENVPEEYCEDIGGLALPR